MTPVELQAALAKTPARSAQVLSHRLLEAKSREACAALYGLPLEAWDVLFLRATQDFERALGRSVATGDESAAARRLSDSLTPELRELEAHREELKRLIDKAHADYEASPSHTLEVWARRIAIIVIVALTAWFYWREERQKKPIPYAPYLTEPKKK
jgi:hypothetical protein